MGFKSYLDDHFVLSVIFKSPRDHIYRGSKNNNNNIIIIVVVVVVVAVVVVAVIRRRTVLMLSFGALSLRNNNEKI